ncbi:MAG: NYN domain-containing protein [Actinomyces urogenitalis]|uniref:NYN domain-containing protein n=1 Tax=Actinomyces urogenitalis TaxID=103621 RepID=UPI0006600065|nr:NYN domain-containing protein [Actinomyces urogenitalis]MBS5977310.1 NYN domain-containing protein [Actinomyces urogenitalis]MBS6072762.1 NYN domain-containing protein [Actinomyces urogenitalis]MDU7427698.1 NYN domain-containing protein [Actinomyces urogenitalis]
MTVVRSNLQYPPQWPSQPAAEKGIDVALAVNVVKYAMLGNIDAAIVFTSDKDIPPAIELVYADTPCHVELACWSGGRRLRFEGTQAPWCHFLKESDFLSIRDLTDYTGPNPVRMSQPSSEVSPSGDAGASESCHAWSAAVPVGDTRCQDPG